MAKEVEVFKRRTNVVLVDLSVYGDISGDTFKSEIREGQDNTTTLIATWDIDFEDDGTDGILRLTLDDSITMDITQSFGWMDMERTSGGEPLAVWGKPIKVNFLKVVTE